VLGDQDKIRQFAATGVDLNGKDSSGITLLCKSDNPEVIRLLLSLGANPNVACDDGRTPLIVALKSQVPISTIQALLDAGAKPETRDSSGLTPLMHASRNSDSEIVGALLERRVDVNAVDDFGRNALYAARKRPAILALLREFGAAD
jgi:ankyrin repeat protein